MVRRLEGEPELQRRASLGFGQGMMLQLFCCGVLAFVLVETHTIACSLPGGSTERYHAEPPGKLSPTTCRNLLADPDFLFRRMWGISERSQNHRGTSACWDVGREERWANDQFPSDPELYFDEIERGVHCDDDWCVTGRATHITLD